MKKFLPFLLIAVRVMAADYYVNPSTGNDANAGTIGAPWRTLQNSVKKGYPAVFLQPGDTLWLRGGTYTGTDQHIDLSIRNGSPVSGTSGNPITIKAYPGETPMLSGGRLGDANTGRKFMFLGLNWWVLDGLSFDDNYLHLQIKNGSNWVVQNCSFGGVPTDATTSDDFGYAGVSIYAESWPADDPPIDGHDKTQKNTIRGCTFTGWGKIFYDSDLGYWNDEGVSLSIGDETADFRMWYNLIENNTFINGCHDHFQLNDGYNVIRNNLFVQVPHFASSQPYYRNAGGWPATDANPYTLWGNRHSKPGDAGYYQIDMRNVWEGNTHLYSGPPPDDFGAFGLEIGTSRSIYRNNVIAFTLSAGMMLGGSGTTSVWTQNAIYNNVIYGCGSSFDYPTTNTGLRSYSYGLSQNRVTTVVGFTADATTDILTYVPATDEEIGTLVPVTLTTTGTLPGGLSVATTYWTVRQGLTQTGKLATSYANAVAGTTINITSAGSGTHTLTVDRVAGNYIVNNIIVGNRGKNNPVESDTGADGNVEPGVAGAQIMRGNIISDAVDPMFVSTAGAGYTYNPAVLPDFHLQSGSPALNAGVHLAFAVGSGSGTTLVVDNSLYFSDGNQIVTGDTIRLEGTSQTAVVTANDWINNTLTLDTSLTWTNGQGVSLNYTGSAPNVGAFGLASGTTLTATTLNVGTLIIQ